MSFEFKPGQIFFFNGQTGMFARAIKAYNRKYFGYSGATHCGIIVEANSESVLIYEATNKGFVANWYDTLWLLGDERVHIGEFKEKVTNVKLNCEKYKDIKYGWLDIASIALSYVLGKQIIGITGKNAIICSEAVSRVAYDCSKTIDFQKEWGTSFDTITPMHIFTSKQVRLIK